MTHIAVEILNAFIFQQKREIKMESIFCTQCKALSFTNQISFSRAYSLEKSALHIIPHLYGKHIRYSGYYKFAIGTCTPIQRNKSYFKAAFVSTVGASWKSLHEQHLPNSIDSVDGHHLFAASKKHKNTGYNGHKRQISLHTYIRGSETLVIQQYRERTSAHFENFSRISMHVFVCTIHASKGRP